MINAIGVVDFHYKPTQTSNYKVNVTNKINRMTNRYKDSFEVISVSSPYDENGDIHVRVSCSFNINMEEIPYCRTIDDYVGQVFPTLKNRISTKIISTQVHALNRIQFTYQ